jgi:hypothetical protein
VKDAYEVLRQKEAALARTRHEVECLRTAAPLLQDELTSENPDSRSEGSEERGVEEEPESKAGGLVSASDSRPSLGRVLKHGQ